jgi:hypothetical protein
VPPGREVNCELQKQHALAPGARACWRRLRLCAHFLEPPPPAIEKQCEKEAMRRGGEMRKASSMGAAQTREWAPASPRRLLILLPLALEVRC